MTLEEAQQIGKIVATADGGCDGCARDLVKQLNEAFPSFEWELTEWYCPGQTVLAKERK
jgi:hypothetical protein